MKSFEFTSKRRENFGKMLVNAAIVVLAALVVGSFASGPFRPKVFVAGSALYAAIVVTVWFLES